MVRPPPTSTLFPYTTLFRSALIKETLGNTWLEFVEESPKFYREWVEAGLEAIGTAHKLVRVEGNPAVVFGTQHPLWRYPDRKSTRLNSSHGYISYAVFCLKK